MSLTNRSIVPAAVLMLVVGTLSSRATSSRDDFGNVYASRTPVRLAFASISRDARGTRLGATEGDVYSRTYAEFAWEAPDAGRTAYYYMVATQPFPSGAPRRDPPGLVDVGLATPVLFTIRPARFPRLINRWRRTRDLFIRIVPVVNGVIVGPASNTVVIHYKFGSDPNGKVWVEHPVLWGDTVTAPPHPTSPSRAP